MYRIYLVLFTLSLLLLPQPSRAEQAIQVGITPVFSLVTINPGTTTTRKLTVTNQSNLALSISAESRGFIASDENGGSDFPNSKSGPQHWFSFEPNKFLLAAHSSRAVAVTIAVPPDAISGGQYASVFFIATAPPDPNSAATQVNFSARIGTYFFMTVGGNIHPDGKLVGFSTAYFWQHAPIRFRIDIHNFGNIHIKPHSALQITNIFGKSVYKTADPGLFVLPGKTRTWQIIASQKLHPGFYTAYLKTKITSKSAETIRVVHFWVIPWQLITLLAVIIVSAWIILRPQLRELHRSYKEAGGGKYVAKKCKASCSNLVKKITRIYQRLRSRLRLHK